MPLFPVAIVNDQEALAIDRRRLRRLVRRTLRDENVSDGAVTVLVTGDARMRDLSARFLGRARTTDVLAFPEAARRDAVRRVPEAEEGLLGEVAVNAERARREARRRGLSCEAELLLYVVHGLLHLVGYDDQEPTDARRMHEREAAVLRRFGLGAVYQAPVRRTR